MATLRFPGNPHTQLHAFCEASDVSSVRLFLRAGEGYVDYQDKVRTSTQLRYGSSYAASKRVAG